MAQSERPVLFDPLSDIANKKFTVVMRGYDRDEVDEFLSKLELSFKGALHEATQISASDLAARLGQEVGSVLASAEQAADKVRRSAAQDAARIRGQAEHEASAIRQAALEEVEALPRAAAEEAEEIIKQAEADATSIRDRATADAGEVIREAKMIATRLENAAKAQCAELLDDALRRRRVLDERQREITKRIDYLDEAFAELRKVTEEFPDYTPVEVPALESARVIDVTDEATKPSAASAGMSNRKRSTGSDVTAAAQGGTEQSSPDRGSERGSESAAQPARREGPGPARAQESSAPERRQGDGSVASSSDSPTAPRSTR
jgi:DivIVA domain-containing protein